MTPMFVRSLSRIKRPFTCKNVKKLCTQTFPDEDKYFEEKPHTPVMLDEVIENLDLQNGDMFLDMTFGAGGHSSALLEKIPDLKVLALDRDPLAIEYAYKLKKKYPKQVTPLLGKFSDLPVLLAKIGIKYNSIDGMLFDLGCSSMQFDIAERGFSIIKDGPLDMRMDGKRIPNQLTAANVIAHASHNELYHIFKVYGNEKRAVKLATEIVEVRQNFKPPQTTKELRDLVETIIGSEDRRDKLNRPTHPATKVFQALRIFVNNELNELNYGLSVGWNYLKPNKKVVAISFHSLEDQILKRHFSNHVIDSCVKPLPLALVNSNKYFSFEEMSEFEKKLWNSMYKKVITPTEEEVSRNPRSRSAKLRVAVKLELEDDE